jgi:acetyl-CoA synthetase
LSIVIRKTSPHRDPPPLLLDYAAARSSFSWETVASGLGIPLAGPLNLGTLATSRGGSLVWLGATGEEVRLSTGDLAAASARAANALAALGVRKGDRVAFMIRSCPELFFGILGALRMGAVAVVLARVRNAEAIRTILERSGAVAAVFEPDYKPVLDTLRPGLPALKTVVCLARAGLVLPGEPVWEKLLEAAPSVFEDVPVGPEDPAWLHYSDLTVGAAVEGHRGAFALAHSAAAALDLRASDGVITIAVPGDTLYVPYLLLAPLLAGATSYAFEDPARYTKYGVFRDPVHVWYSASRAIDVILRTDPGLGTMLGRCRHIAVTHPYDTEFAALTQLSYGSPIHATWFPRDIGAIQSAEFRAHDLRLGSAGRALPGCELAPDPESGRLAVRLGPSTPFTGFWDDPAQSEKRLKNGWFVTDHAAKLDPDGYAWIAS